MEKKTIEQWREELTPVLESKRSEWELIGYTNITMEDLWECLIKNIWQENPRKRLHEVVQDIFHLSITTYMNYRTVDTLQADDDLLQSIEDVMGRHNEQEQ